MLLMGGVIKWRCRGIKGEVLFLCLLAELVLGVVVIILDVRISDEGGKGRGGIADDDDGGGGGGGGDVVKSEVPHRRRALVVERLEDCRNFLILLWRGRTGGMLLLWLL